MSFNSLESRLEFATFQVAKLEAKLEGSHAQRFCTDPQKGAGVLLTLALAEGDKEPLAFCFSQDSTDILVCSSPCMPKLEYRHAERMQNAPTAAFIPSVSPMTAAAKAVPQIGSVEKIRVVSVADNVSNAMVSM